jgi:gliding motility-associated-like protein
MKVKLTYLFIYLFIYLNGIGQINLVSNPSFETYSPACDFGMGISILMSWVPQWQTNHNSSTPDYYNVCANNIPLNPINLSSVPLSCRGFQNPRTGDGYMGLGLYSDEYNPTDTVNVLSEYLSTQLTTALKANTCYYGEIYVNLANSSLQTVNQISMLFSNPNFTTTAFSFTNTIQPQIQYDTTLFLTDTLNWIKVSGKFIAQGGEQFLTIGNFRDGAHLAKKTVSSNFTSPICAGVFRYAYIHIDDVTVYEIPKPQLGSDFEYCLEADSVLIGDTTLFGNEFKWYANGILIDTLNKQIKIKPTINTTYMLQNGGCAADTLVVTFKSCPLPEQPIEIVEPIIPNVFTPNNDSINDVWRYYLGKGNSLKSLNIYNRWGNEIAINSRTTVTQINWDGRTTSGEETPSGIYFYVLQYTDANGDEHKKNGYITLIR